MLERDQTQPGLGLISPAELVVALLVLVPATSAVLTATLAAHQDS